VLIGRKDFIQQARRLRKVMGGGMRQAGYLAAACIYALDHQVERLRDDNERARRIGEVLQGLNYVESVRPVQSNILIFDLVEGLTADKFLEELKARGINASAFGPLTVRFVTHLDFTEQMMDQVLAVLKQI
jgi:threonine aldolase